MVISSVRTFIVITGLFSLLVLLINITITLISKIPIHYKAADTVFEVGEKGKVRKTLKMYL